MTKERKKGKNVFKEGSNAKKEAMTKEAKVDNWMKERNVGRVPGRMMQGRKRTRMYERKEVK